ncbi:hypothetical protein APHAL10511_004542 [Amanita phalloides]|nr:hypothetical protein APHAL10511_004542 [Amanita phalloides]
MAYLYLYRRIVDTETVVAVTAANLKDRQSPGPESVRTDFLGTPLLQNLTKMPSSSKSTFSSSIKAQRRGLKSKVTAPEKSSEEEHDNNTQESTGEYEGLHGFTTDDEDSSDEDDGVDADPDPVDVGKLPTVAKDDAVVKAKLEKAKRQLTEDHGVIYIGRLPHGFFEDQLRGYFSQFGNVTRLRLSRNKKTGKSKHYAFLEFDSSSVAKIVAETMDNYLIMGHLLQCKIVPKDKVHPQLWVGANRKWRVVPRARVVRLAHNKKRTQEEQDKAEKRLLRRQRERKRKLAEAGIEYELDAVMYKRR